METRHDSLADTDLQLDAGISDSNTYGVYNRYRFEQIVDDSEKSPYEASSLMLRAFYNMRFRRHLNLFVEGSGAQKIGGGHHEENQRVGANDPEYIGVNQAYLEWSGDRWASRAGRQVIELDNQRMIGSDRWRQNQQSFDSVMLTLRPTTNWRILYAYLNRIQTVSDPDRPEGSIDSHSQLWHLSYAYTYFKTSLYRYHIKLGDQTPLLTQGARITGKSAGKRTYLTYELEYAKQDVEGPFDAEHEYRKLSFELHVNTWALQLAYEKLSGQSGRSEFTTPLAALHEHNGWSHLFVHGTQGAGLVDHSVKLKRRLNGLDLTLSYHAFTNPTAHPLWGELDYGDEIGVQIEEELGRGFSYILRFVDFRAEDGGAVVKDQTRLVLAFIWRK